MNFSKQTREGMSNRRNNSHSQNGTKQRSLSDLSLEVETTFFSEFSNHEILEMNAITGKEQNDLQVDKLINATEDFVKSYANNITTTQLRNIYSKITGVKTPMELKLLRPNLAYIAAKQGSDNAKKMIAFIDTLIQQVNNDMKLKSFKRFMESVIAYHKFYNTKK